MFKSVITLLLCSSITTALIAQSQPSTVETNASQDWKIGGKIHFEEQGSSNYIGTIEINELTRAIIKKFYKVNIDSCSNNAKILLKKENDKIILTHREERSVPGVGEELHATLLYTSKRINRGHETLSDIYDNLKQVDPSLPQDQAPTVEQIAGAYHRIIKPDRIFQASDVEFITNNTGSFIIVKLRFDGRDEILNSEGAPISGDFLHLTAAMIDPSIDLEMSKTNLIVSELKDRLIGKTLKIGNRNGYADLEFGISGSASRVRPPVAKGINLTSHQEKFPVLKSFN